MKNSRTSLNKPFYDWIKEVREADKKIVELEDKLYYYNVKLIGYNSPDFEPRLSSTKPEYKDNRYIWIAKIDKVESLISKYKKTIRAYDLFLKSISENQKKILFLYISDKVCESKFSKAYIYKVLSDISFTYSKYSKRS